MTVNLGIIKEGRQPIDVRVPLTPGNCRLLLDTYPNLNIFVQSCPYRCYSDDEYEREGIPVQTDMINCDVLLGVKEVQINDLIPDKKYLFFSHTIKKQAFNRQLLSEIMSKKIQLIDYECLTIDSGARIIGFGRFAGIVGTHNGFLTWGRKYGQFDLKPAHECHDYEELKTQYENLTLSPLKIVLTGNGRVAKGSLEVMDMLNLRKVEPEDFLANDYDEAVFTQLDVKELYALEGNEEFEFQDFFDDPGKFHSIFKPYTKVSDLMINAIYYDPRAPRFFSIEDMQSEDFKTKVIADISCDIKEGAIPCTLKATSIDNPVFGFDAANNKMVEPYQKEFIDVMAVDNLPNELPRDASSDFGQALIENVLEHLINNGDDPIIQRATITKDGNLCPDYEYLRDFVENGEELTVES